MNIHTTVLCLPLTEPALFHPLEGWREEGQSPAPVGFGAYFEERPFWRAKPRRALNLSNTLLLLSSSLAVLLSSGNVCGMIARETGFSWPSEWNLGCWAEQVSPIVSATFLRLIVCSKHTTDCYLFFPEGRSRFPAFCKFPSQAPGKALVRFPFWRAVTPEPGLLGSNSNLKRKGTAMCTHLLHPFCSVGEV